VKELPAVAIFLLCRIKHALACIDSPYFLVVKANLYKFLSYQSGSTAHVKDSSSVRVQFFCKLGAVLWVRVAHAEHDVVILIRYLVVGLFDSFLSEVVEVFNILL
jgi:hypothetical protein